MPYAKVTSWIDQLTSCGFEPEHCYQLWNGYISWESRSHLTLFSPDLDAAVADFRAAFYALADGVLSLQHLESEPGSGQHYYRPWASDRWDRLSTDEYDLLYAKDMDALRRGCQDLWRAYEALLYTVGRVLPELVPLPPYGFGDTPTASDGS